MKKKKRRFKHLNQLDRDRIEALLSSGHKQKEIASILQVDKGTVSREINSRKRRDGRYEATNAQRKSRVARIASRYQGMKIEKYPDLRQKIVAGLRAKQSPDAIAGRMREEGILPRVGAKSIYRWLYSSWGQMYCHLLCTKRYKRKGQKRAAKREMIPDRIPLVLRPKGGIHAEGDLFVSSKRSGAKRSGLIVTVPSSQLIIGKMIENKRPVVMAQAVREIKRDIEIDDMTLDNGIENRDHKDFGFPVYFCDPHSPWQKPHVEQAIGLLRRWFIKKKTDLTTVSEKDLQNYLHILNSKWRKSLGYKSAYEVSLEHGILKTKIPLRRDKANKSCISV